MQFCSCGNQGVILLLLCCSIIETLETGLEHILLVVKLTLVVLMSLSLSHQNGAILLVTVVSVLLGFHKYDADYSVQLE